MFDTRYSGVCQIALYMCIYIYHKLTILIFYNYQHVYLSASIYLLDSIGYINNPVILYQSLKALLNLWLGLGQPFRKYYCSEWQTKISQNLLLSMYILLSILVCIHMTTTYILQYFIQQYISKCVHTYICMQQYGIRIRTIGLYYTTVSSTTLFTA